MSGARGPEFISAKAKACSEAFDMCNGISQHFFTADLQDQCGRFNVWTATTGVFAHPRASLDFRLREAPEVRAMIIGMLSVILQSIQSVEKISNMHAKPFQFIDATATLDQSTKKEIAQNIKSVSDDIGLLYRLSYTIRRASAERVYREAAAEPRLTDEFSQRFKSDARQFLAWQFQTLSETVRERVALAMLIRRNRFQYLQERYGDKPEIYPGSTQLELHRLDSLGILPVQQSPSQAVSPIPTATRLGQTSFRRSSKTSSSPEHELSFPAPPQACNGTQAKCPYCLITLPITDFEPDKWIDHVKADLDPYVCLNERCELPPNRMLFERKQDWIEHMRQSHLLKWRCRTEDHEETFNTESDFMVHLRSYHAGDFEEDDLPLLAEMSARPIGDTFESCPFCGNNNLSGADLENHVSDHLIKIALLSLPPRDDIGGNRHGSCSSVETDSSTDTTVPFDRSTTDGVYLESPRYPQPKERSASTPSIERDDPDLASDPIVRSPSGSNVLGSLEKVRTYEVETVLKSRRCLFDEKSRWPPSQTQ